MIKRAHLRQFIAVVDAGNFTRAAERLGLTQPTLSAGIAELERITAARLFLREKRRVRLTDAGNRLLAHARAIEREFRAAEAGLSSAAATAEPVRLGVLLSIATSFLGALGQGYAGARPLALVEGSDAELRRRLSEGRLDAVLTVLRPGDGARDAASLFEEPYCLMLPSSHPFAGEEVIEPRALAGETMIARRSCELLAETSRFFTERGVRPPFFLRSANDDRCMAMVRAGMGVTTAPLSLAGDGVVARPLRDYDFRRQVGLISGAPVDPALLAACHTASAQH